MDANVYMHVCKGTFLENGIKMIGKENRMQSLIIWTAKWTTGCLFILYVAVSLEHIYSMYGVPHV